MTTSKSTEDLWKEKVMLEELARTTTDPKILDTIAHLLSIIYAELSD
jgi:hypothetical protein